MVENPFTWSLPYKISPLLQQISPFITTDAGRKEKCSLKSSAVDADVGLQLGMEHSTSQRVRMWGRLEEERGQLPITLGNVQRKNKQIDTLEGLVQLQDVKDTADIFQKRICHEH